MTYEEDWPTCTRTYSTLRVFSDDYSPEAITELLAITPSNSFARGSPYGQREFVRKFNGWFLSSEITIDSKDTRRHTDWLISQLACKKAELIKLRKAGATLDICCAWFSSGQGGPLITPRQMRSLAELEIEIWWDVYFDPPS